MRVIAALLVVASVEVALSAAFLAAFQGEIPLAALPPHTIFATLLSAHAGAALLLGIVVARPADAALGAASTAAVLFAGPVGVLAAAFVAASLARARRRPSADRETWYRSLARHATIDPVARLCGDITNGRAFDPALARVVPFARVARAGDLAAQQRLLGIVAREPDPALARHLRTLLRSPRAAVRASAAAALARLREDVRTRAGAVRGSRDEAAAESRARVLAACANAGVLDDADAQSLRRTALGLLAAHPPGASDAADALAAELLLAEGRYREALERLEASPTCEPEAEALLKRARLGAAGAGEPAS
ncbi:hypothetical protein [Salinarimonas sp.]|uniref:hypothetical protein n=1 Tax=Salinarimonas sp. TaxID=2766526 RepID=UPI0039195C9F